MTFAHAVDIDRLRQNLMNHVVLLHQKWLLYQFESYMDFKNFSAYFPSTISPLFAELKHEVNEWIDEFTFHVKTELELLDHLIEFFNIYRKHTLKLSATKSVLYTKEDKWRGLIVNQNGYRLDRRNRKGIQTMEDYINAVKHCQFIHCCGWISTLVLDYRQQMQALDKVLGKAYAKAGKQSRSSS